MSEPSDWDPLPTPQVEAWIDGGMQGLGPKPPVSAQAPRPEPAADPAAAAVALAALQRRLRAAEPRDPVRVALERAAERADLRGHRGAAATADAEVLVRVPPPVATPEYSEGRDGREDEAWFRDLPAAEQERLRQAWRQQADSVRLRPRITRRMLLAGAGQGAFVFGIASLLQLPLLGFGVVPVMLSAGCVAGALMQLTQRGRFQCSLVGGLVYLFAIVVPMQVVGGGLESMVAQILPILYGLAIVTWASGLIGMDREIRQAGGFRDSA